MAVFLNRPSQQYAPDTYNVNGNVPGGAIVSSIKCSVSREAWPEGPIGIVTLNFPDGNTSGFSFSGGDAFNKDGSISTESTAQWYAPAGTKYPAGAYTLVFVVLQIVNSAVKVEWF